MFYLLGCALFAASMSAALFVMLLDFNHYRKAMFAALRSLSLEGWTPPKTEPVSPTYKSIVTQPVPALARPQRAAF